MNSDITVTMTPVSTTTSRDAKGVVQTIVSYHGDGFIWPPPLIVWILVGLAVLIIFCIVMAFRPARGSHTSERKIRKETEQVINRINSRYDAAKDVADKLTKTSSWREW